ncbi:class I SAM-dependent methyltransferase [Campylobacter upsaliensis]|uniref:class I SAM-dependent methyltransferase n=1 Tax=Campylobacter upsaliensis TaxID=28080 RepID=UPI0022EB0710|nr:class I SAM-dependent methyltransferase [Campylobacter upsaliensis]MEB2804673.1 class I SAM-dependent methyltransferase [Campylobacter upsaliensis]MEB2817981.1 class I SAM-dependent methyltransferase [Campylobacter upsaliensis]
MNKISLFRSLKREGGLENFALKAGYNHTNILDEMVLFELSDPIILYAQDTEFFYADFDNYEDFDKNEIKFASKQEIIIINAKICFIAKKHFKTYIQIFYKKQFNKINNVQFFKEMEEVISHINPYYLGYEKRYEKVYKSGASTWESTLANESLIAVYRQFKNYFNDKKVIDLGCGEGRDSIFLKKNGVNVIGVDISHCALTKARELSKAQNLDIDFIEANVLFLNAFEDECFDTAINMGCLHMIVNEEERKKHIFNVYRILKKGGIFIVDHCQRNWGRGFFSLPSHLYNKNKMVVGNVIKRRIRTKNGDRLIDLEVIPYLEKEKDKLIKEICSFGFKVQYSLNTDTEAFGDSTLIIFKKD